MPSTATEQYLLELINDARLDPLGDAARYISSYAPLTSPETDIQQALSFFGVDGNQLLAAFQALTPAQPLAFSDVLAGGARAHDQAMITAGQQSHQLPGEPDLGTRVAAEGYAFTSVGENIFAYAKDMLYAQAGFMVDWGGSAATGGMQSPAGHRANIMNPAFREVGVGVVADSTSGSALGPQVVTEDFGTRGTSGSFLLGVAYDDLAHNGFYSIGEGVAGLMVSVGGSSTTSSDSGGWTLATALTGTQTVDLSGAGLSAPVDVQMALTDAAGNGLNAKIDVIGGDTLQLSASAIVTGAVSTVQVLNAQGLTVTLGDGVGRTLLGSSGGDTLTGGSGNDIIDGGFGSNILDGGGGTNTAVFDFASTVATISQSGSSFVVDAAGTHDVLTNFAAFRFTDGTMTPGGALTGPAPTVAFDAHASFVNGVTPTMTGSVTRSSDKVSVEIFNGATDLGAAAVAGDGTWSFTANHGAGDFNALSAVATDASGTSAHVASTYELLTGITGQSYRAQELDHAADGSLLGLTNFGKDGAVLSQTVDNGDGTHRITGFADGQTLTSQFNDVMTGGGTHERFVFVPHFGQEEITDFLVAGQAHDTIDLSATHFSTLTQVLRSITMSRAGAVIHVDARDMITLDSVTKAELKAHPKDFALG